MPQTPKPQEFTSHAAVVSKFYGFYISLPARDWFAMQMSQVPPEVQKEEIVVSYGAETKCYTFDEFMLLLGFTNPLPVKHEEKTK